MNYYIQGSPARAEEIKAAFNKFVSIQEMAAYDFSQEEYLFYTGQEERGTFVYAVWNDGVIANIIKTHPDYKELELPVEFKNGDIIGFNDCTHNDGSYVDWVGIYKQGIETNQHLFHCVIPSCRSFRVGGMWRVFTAYPATKEQRDLLFKKMKEAGYEWDAEKKELRKIINPKFKVGDEIIWNEPKGRKPTEPVKIIRLINEDQLYMVDMGNGIGHISYDMQDYYKLVPKKHYDISNFSAGMPVLVRDSIYTKWLYTIFGIYNKDNLVYPFVVVNMQGYAQCIPFNDDTKHLLGTTDMCDEQYINW